MRQTTHAAFTPVLESEVTCPHCGVRHWEKMPADALVYFYECPACGTTLQPKEGECCVFCSYGSVPCPPTQGPDGRGAAKGSRCP